MATSAARWPITPTRPRPLRGATACTTNPDPNPNPNPDPSPNPNPNCTNPNPNPNPNLNPNQARLPALLLARAVGHVGPRAVQLAPEQPAVRAEGGRLNSVSCQSCFSELVTKPRTKSVKQTPKPITLLRMGLLGQSLGVPVYTLHPATIAFQTCTTADVWVETCLVSKGATCLVEPRQVPP